MSISLIIADSNSLSRLGLCALFREEAGINILGESDNEVDLLSRIKKAQTDVVLMDYTAPGFDVSSVKKVKRLRRAPKVVAITPEQSGVTIINALKAGVDSYIKKDCDLEEIRDAVRKTGAGDQFFCGQILDVIKKEKIDPQNIDAVDVNCAPIVISKRETEVIALIAEGYTNGQIAEKLFLSSHTVNTHRKNIMAKLGVNNTAAIVMYAVKRDLVSPNKFLFS